MAKKLVSLIFVLALVGVVSANTWSICLYDPLPCGDWADPANWSDGVPTATDATVKLQSINCGYNSCIIIHSGTDAFGGVKLQNTSVGTRPVSLEIENDASLTHSGSFDGYTGSFVGTIDADGVWNACTTGGTFKMASNTAAGVTNSVTVNVYGTLNVKGTGTSILGLVNDFRAGTSGTNSATVNIRSGGLVDVDSYTIDIYGTGHINIWDGGTMKIKGNVTAQTSADILNSKIAGQGISLATYYVARENMTYVVSEWDALIDFGDFARFSELWSQTGTGLAADLDGDDDVDLEDLRLFSEGWLQPCTPDWQLK